MSPLPDIAHWWAIEAMIASYNHVYHSVFGTTYKTLGVIGVSDYGSAPISSFQLEFLALDDNPDAVANAIRQFPVNHCEFVLDVFHESPSVPGLKARYDDLGYEFVRTGPILGLELPIPVRGDTSFVKAVETAEQVGFANKSLALEGEKIPIETLGDVRVQNFYAEVDGQAAGWAQLVTVYPGTGYVNQLHVLEKYRGHKVGSALVERTHLECDRRGLGRMVLVSSDMAMGLYRRLGYRPLAYFTVFRPKETS
jgi:ribosomal protein S18 acetylase RimI-like enzyme